MGSHTEASPGEKLQSALHGLVITTIILFVGMFSLGTYVYMDGDSQRTELAKVAMTTNTALCTLRADLERRVQDSEEFLLEHPDGIPGIDPQIIKDSIENQKRTIKALDILDCTPPAVLE